LKDLLQFGGRDDRLVRTEDLLAPVGDRLLQIADDLAAVGIPGERALRAGEIVKERVVAGFVDLVRVSVQIDADDFLHGYRPR
jgi:hypothetical protein